MTLKQLLNENQLTIEMINSKLNEKDISETNLDSRLEDILGKEYIYARELNKKHQKYKNEINELSNRNKNLFIYDDKSSKVKGLVDSNYEYFYNKADNNYFDVNEIYKTLSDVSIEDFEKILKKVESKGSFDIFLSHSMKDKLLVFGVYLILTEDFNKKVYVDWIVDPFLSDTRDKVALRNIRMLQIRMIQSNKLHLLKTVNYSVSKWVAWEIGFFNGKSNNLFILRVFDFDCDDDNSGMGFIKIYRDLIIYDNKLMYLERGKLVQMT